MPIPITCPKCLKRFQVSDKFAGKTGPCPSCKNPIKIPTADEQVVIHAPESDAPKDSTGQSVLKPITGTETDVTRKGLIVTILAIVAIFAAALALRFVGEGSAPFWAQLLGIFVLAPPMIWASYSFVYNRELEPYRGRELHQRVGILSLIFAAMWLIYAFVPAYVFDLDQASEASWTIAGVIFAIMIGAGAVAAAATFEVEFTSGLVQSGMYFLGVVALALIAGVTLAGREPVTRPGLPTSWHAPAVESFAGDDTSPLRERTEQMLRRSDVA